jgi:membrane fusion protein (multidrug efflux system)
LGRNDKQSDRSIWNKKTASIWIFMQKLITILIFLTLILSSAAILIVTSCNRKPPVIPPQIVEVTKVITKDIPISAEWVGTTDGLINATIRPQVQGFLISQNYKDGAYVQKGELLFEIDPRPFQAALKQVTAQLTQIRAQYYIAQNELKRVRPLALAKALSQRDLDNAIGNERNTRGALKAAEAAVMIASLNLSFTKIRSPINGIAAIAQGQIGNLVGPSQTTALTTVSYIDSILVRYSVSEQYYIEQARRIMADSSERENRKQVTYELILADGSQYPYEGEFYSINNQVNTGTGTIELEAIFPNPQRIIRPGQFGRIRVTTGINQNALLIPQRAVTQIQGKYMVAVVTPQSRIDIRTVQVGQKIGSLWEINRGLTSDETVVTEGIMKVKPNELVSQQPFTGDTSEKQSSSFDSSEGY